MGIFGAAHEAQGTKAVSHGADIWSPVVRRRELGAILRSLRLNAGLTVDDVAGRLLCSASQVSRMETGNRVATVRNVRDLCDLYRVTDPAERDRLMKLAREGGQRGWWEAYDILYKKYVGLEAEALSIRGYQSSVVPGLLQTAEYARAIQEGSIPRLNDEEIQQGVEVRLRRQRLLVQQPPLRFWEVIDEAALRRLVGGRAVMAAQLDQILEACELGSVTVQVVPFSVGAHAGLENNFKILELPPPAPSIVYTEGLARSSYFDRPGDVAHFERVFDQLTRAALSPVDTIELIRTIRESMA